MLVNELNNLGSLTVTYISRDTLHCVLDNVQLTFLYFPNTLIKELVKVDEYNNLYLANIVDIAVMKLIAISQRGTKKDFFDLYNICTKYNYSLKDIFKFLDIKYSKDKLNYFHILKGYYSLWELYKNSGVPKSTINGLLSTNIHSLPRLPTLLYICEGLGTNLKEFFDDDIFLNVEDNAEDKK